MRGPSVFAGLPDKCDGNSPAIISNYIKFHLLNTHFSQSDDEIWLGIKLTSQGICLKSDVGQNEIAKIKEFKITMTCHIHMLLICPVLAMFIKTYASGGMVLQTTGISAMFIVTHFSNRFSL